MTATTTRTRLVVVGSLAEVVARVERDPEFVRAVRSDPRSALEPFELDPEELRVLAYWLEHRDVHAPSLDDLFE